MQGLWEKDVEQIMLVAKQAFSLNKNISNNKLT